MGRILCTSEKHAGPFPASICQGCGLIVAQPVAVTPPKPLEPPQEATGTSCEVFIPVGSPGISWERPAPGTRPDIVGVRHLEDGSTEYLMHNEALCDPYYVGRSLDVEPKPIATTQGDTVAVDCCKGSAPAHECYKSCGGTKPDLDPNVKGTWPTPCLQRAFVDGVKWWQFVKLGSTAFPSEIDEAEREAVIRFGEPKPAPLGEVSELERKCLYQVAEITAQLSQVQAPLLQKIAELEEKFTRYENQLSKAGSDAFIAQAKADDLEVKLEKAEGRIGLLRVEKADAEARIAELESAQPKAEKVEER